MLLDHPILPAENHLLTVDRVGHIYSTCCYMGPQVLARHEERIYIMIGGGLPSLASQKPEPANL